MHEDLSHFFNFYVRSQMQLTGYFWQMKTLNNAVHALQQCRCESFTRQAGIITPREYVTTEIAKSKK